MTSSALQAGGRSREADFTFIVGLNLCLAGIYANFTVNVGGAWYPGIAIIVGAVFLIPHATPHAKSLVWLGWLLLFLVLSFVAAGRWSGVGDSRVTSLLQIIAALGCAHIMLCAIKYPEAVRKSLFIWMTFIVVGVILETMFSPIRDLSDAFRHAVFEGRFLYESDTRDLHDYGFVRPKLFTREPSHVGMAFITFGAGWYVLSSFRRRLILLLVSMAVTIIFLGSPLVLLVLPLAWFLNRMAAGRGGAGIVTAGVPVLGIVVILLTQAFSARLATIASGQDMSYFGRFQGPYEVAFKTVEQYPILGVGIGGKQALFDSIRMVYSRSSGFEPLWVYHNYLNILSNGFANSISFFGIVGAAIFYFLVAQWIRGFGVRVLVSIPVIVLLLQLDGAIESLRMWGAIAVVMACYVMAKRMRQMPAGDPESRPPLHLPHVR